MKVPSDLRVALKAVHEEERANAQRQQKDRQRRAIDHLLEGTPAAREAVRRVRAAKLELSQAEEALEVFGLALDWNAELGVGDEATFRKVMGWRAPDSWSVNSIVIALSLADTKDQFDRILAGVGITWK